MEEQGWRQLTSDGDGQQRDSTWTLLLLLIHDTRNNPKQLFFFRKTKAHQGGGEEGGGGGGGGAKGSRGATCLHGKGQFFDGFGFTDREGQNLKISYRPRTG